MKNRVKPFDFCDSSDLPFLRSHLQVCPRKGSLKWRASGLDMPFIHTHSTTVESPEDPLPLGKLLSTGPNPPTRQSAPLASGLAPRKPLDSLGDEERNTHLSGEACGRSSRPGGRGKRLTGHTRRDRTTRHTKPRRGGRSGLRHPHPAPDLPPQRPHRQHNF